MIDAASVGIFQALVNAGSAIANATDAAKRQAQLVEFQKVAIQANATIAELQNSKSALLADKQELEKECMRLNDWSAEKQNYTRRQIGEGVFAYVENSPVESLQAAHKLCCNYFSKTLQSTLQQTREQTRMVGLECPNGCPKLVFTHYL